MKKSFRSALLVLLGITAVPAFAVTFDTRGVTAIDPGLWSVATRGTVHVMGISQPFSKVLRSCVRAGPNPGSLVPAGTGRCAEHETTSAGVMHWNMQCVAANTRVDYACAIRTARRRYDVRCTIHNANPDSLTDYTATGTWLRASCP